VGSGIFLTPSSIAAQVGSGWMLMGVWLIAGLFTFLGGLAYAELGAMFPKAGGQYVYLREAFGAPVAFLFGWTLLLVIQTGTAAAIATGFATYLGVFIPLGAWGLRIVAAVLVLLLSLLNARGVKQGAWIQNGFTVAKVLAITALVLLCFSHPSVPQTQAVALPGFGALGIALAAAFFSYDGWNFVTFASGEMPDAKRTLPRGLLIGIASSVGIYLVLNAAFLRVMPFGQLAQSSRVASDALQRIMGSKGAYLVAIAVLLSTFGSANGCVLGGSRVYYAMGVDGVLPKSLAHLSERGTPTVALALQGSWAAALALSGSFGTLFTYAISSAWLWYGITGLALFVLRARRPDVDRPIRAWGHPITTGAFVLFALSFCALQIATGSAAALKGFGLILLGLPFYFFFRARAQTQT
jgi:basic amino acid/polyamine antiporter, APA family